MAHGAKPYIGEGWATTLPLKPKGQIHMSWRVVFLILFLKKNYWNFAQM